MKQLNNIFQSFKVQTITLKKRWVFCLFVFLIKTNFLKFYLIKLQFKKNLKLNPVLPRNEELRLESLSDLRVCGKDNNFRILCALS